ncbi:TolC family protein [Phragmitibacter flavus]|uniref:TolC family protein n=1 Tax=Phragmitibacter flavus TaxID=2576071 RepID=A0A5R8K9R5_9BACT|nr:TolC family protein [Phragmitibacter flavus]TLD68269.1 TolC family protein [Phragmitibacter flavus]
MSIFRLTLLCSLLVGSASAANLNLSLGDIPRRITDHNPALAAARLTIDEAKARVLGSGRLSNPELGLGFNHDSRFREGTISTSLSQRFPLTSRLRLEKNLSQKLVAAAELEVLDTTRKMIAEAQSLAVQLLSLDQQQTLRQQQLELAKELSQFASDRASKGEISPLDAAQAQVDSQRLILESRKLSANRVNLLGQLKPTLGLAPTDTLTISGDLPAVVLPAKRGGQQRPDYQLHLLREDAALKEIDLARSKKWEDIEAGLLWEGERAEDAPDGLSRTGFIGFQLSIPLPFWNRNQGEIAEKNASAIRSKLETKALNSTINHELSALRDEMQAYAHLAKETKEQLLPLVIEQADRIDQAYQTGQTDLITVLQVRDQRLQLEVAVLEAQRDFHLARIRYEAASAQHVPASSK